MLWTDGAHIGEKSKWRGQETHLFPKGLATVWIWNQASDCICTNLAPACMGLVTQSRLTLCDPLDCNLPSSSVHGIFQARILEWVAIPFSRGSSWPRDQTRISCVSCIAGGFLTLWATGEALCQWYIPFKRIILLPPIDCQLSSETFMPGERVGAEKISPKELRTLSFWERVNINADCVWAFASLASYIKWASFSVSLYIRPLDAPLHTFVRRNSACFWHLASHLWHLLLLNHSTWGSGWWLYPVV